MAAALLIEAARLPRLLSEAALLLIEAARLQDCGLNLHGCRAVD